LKEKIKRMVLILGGFLVIASLSGGLMYAIFTYVLKNENPTDALLFWLLSSGLSVILAGVFVKLVTQLTDITFIDK
jgi:hypothetical protein